MTHRSPFKPLPFCDSVIARATKVAVIIPFVSYQDTEMHQMHHLQKKFPGNSTKNINQ